MHQFPIQMRLIALILALSFTGKAMAQGTQGSLPDPITTPELMRYADRLGLSDEQRRAAERLHDEYRETFRTLREGEIARFLESMRGMQGSMPQRREFEEFMRTWERLSNRIAQIDESLFSRFPEILTEQQMAMLPRIRMDRERNRYRGSLQMMTMGGSPIADLSEIVESMSLHPAERSAIDLALASYEHRLTAAMRDMHRSMNRMYADMYDAFDAAGVTEEMLQDPAEMARVMEVTQEAMREMFGTIAERASVIHDLNEGALRTMRPLLSDESGRALRNRLYSQVYRTAEFALRLPVEQRIAAALSLDEISPSLHESIESLRTNGWQRLDRVLDQAVELHQSMHASTSPFDMMNRDWSDFGEKMRELREQATAIDKDIQQRLTDLLGTELDELTEQAVAEGRGTDESATRRSPRPGTPQVTQVPSSDDDAQPARSRFDHELPDSINARDLAIYADILQLDDSGRVILGELHKNYLDHFESAVEPILQELLQSRGMAYSEAGPDEAAIERSFELRTQALAAILETDAAFFNDMASTFITGDEDYDRLERVQLTRDRAIYSTRSIMSFGPMGVGTNSIARIDLARLIRLQSLHPQELERIENLLMEYQREAAQISRDRFLANLDVTRAQEVWGAQFARTRGDEGNQMARFMEFQEMLREPQRRLTEASQKLVALNESSLEAFLARLSSESARKLHIAFRRQAFPQVYNDPASADDHLASALRLPDLSERQRSELAELLAEYRPTYEDLTEQMVELSRSSRPDAAYSDFQQEDWREFMDLAEKMERLRFERNELNARAITRIKSILSETQLAAVGPLPEPAENRGNIWGF